MFRSKLRFVIAASVRALLPFAAGASSFNVLHIFSQSGDGDTPLAGLLLDASGTLYGTALFGGANDRGTLFRIASGGQEEIVYSFGVGIDAAWPDTELAADAAGNLYGVARAGGSNDLGTAFEWKSSGELIVLHNFDQKAANPVGHLVMDAQGTLYGATSSTGPTGNNGTAYKLRP